MTYSSTVWNKWQEEHNLQHLHMDKLSILFPYLGTYFFTPLTVSKPGCDSLVITNAIGNEMFIEWSSSSIKSDNGKNNNRNQDNEEGCGSSVTIQHVVVNNRHLWLLISGKHKTVVYLCCEYAPRLEELVSYINPYIMVTTTAATTTTEATTTATLLRISGLRNQYRTVCRYDNTVITLMAHATTIKEHIAICHSLNHLTVFQVADYDIGMLHTFDRKGIVSITCWEPNKNNGVYRHHKVTQTDVLKPETELVRILYNSVMCIDVMKPHNDMYLFNNRDSIFYLFDTLVFDGKFVDPITSYPHVCKTLSKRQMRTSTLELHINEITSCVSNVQ
jgi:hypothetical protein